MMSFESTCTLALRIPICKVGASSIIRALENGNSDIKFLKLESHRATRPDMAGLDKIYFKGLNRVTKLGG